MLVTVLMPVYNGAKYVRAAALSILHQTHRELELLAIDDGSTDGTTEILEEIAASDARVKLVVRENRGLVATLNQGLELANGTLVARMDADDIAYSERIATQVEIFETDANLCLLGMGADYLYPDGYVVRSATRSASHDEIRIESMFHCVFIHPTVMLNNEIVQKKNIRYSATNPLNEDHELWSRLVAENASRIISDVGLAWRQHSQSVRNKHFRAQVRAGLDLVQRDLNNNGVEVDISIVQAVSQQRERLTEPQKRQLHDTLREIWHYRSSFSSPPAFERGFSHFLSNIMETSLLLGSPRDLIEVMNRADFAQLLGKRLKLAVRITGLIGNSAAISAMARVRSVGRRIRCDQIKDQENLSADIVRYL